MPPLALNEFLEINDHRLKWSDGVLGEQTPSITPTVHRSNTPSLQCSMTPSSSQQLPLLHVEILRDELRAQFFVVEQRKTHAAPLQNFQIGRASCRERV